MNRIAMSRAAVGVVAGADRPRPRCRAIGFCLPIFQSIDWQSLTFTGERHQIAAACSRARIRREIVERMCDRPRGCGIHYPRACRRRHRARRPARARTGRFDQRHHRSADRRRRLAQRAAQLGQRFEQRLRRVGRLRPRRAPRRVAVDPRLELPGRRHCGAESNRRTTRESGPSRRARRRAPSIGARGRSSASVRQLQQRRVRSSRRFEYCDRTSKRLAACTRVQRDGTSQQQAARPAAATAMPVR